MFPLGGTPGETRSASPRKVSACFLDCREKLCAQLDGHYPRWGVLANSVIVAAATATRPTGVALLAPLLLHVWQISRDGRDFTLKGAFAFSVGCARLVTYMIGLYCTFGNPLVFIESHRHWDQRPTRSALAQLWGDITLEPIECVHDIRCECYVRHGTHDPSPYFSMFFANPVFFAIALFLILFGLYRRWLTSCEGLLGLALLAMSYFGKGYTMCIMGQARYASIVFPVYIVLACLLRYLPPVWVGAVMGAAGFLLGIYSALFVRWFNFY